jgi:hypothetical protein
MTWALEAATASQCLTARLMPHAISALKCQLPVSHSANTVPLGRLYLS